MNKFYILLVNTFTKNKIYEQRNDELDILCQKLNSKIRLQQNQQKIVFPVLFLIRGAQLIIPLSKQVLMQNFQDLSTHENLKEKGESQKELNLVNKKRLNIKKKKPHFHPKLYSNVEIKYVVNIGNICFLAEDALRNPDKSSENVLKSVYHYNGISKVTLNDFFVCMDFKKHCENFLPPEYFIERFKSFGDRRMASMAEYLEKIHQQFSIIKEGSPTNDTSFCRQNEEMMLQKFIQSRKDKKFFLYFSEITPQKITLKNVIFSMPLLNAIGCDVNQIQMDFMKYKNVFFDVYTAKNYGDVMERCFEKFGKIQAQLMLNPELSMEERINLTEFLYYDDVICKKSGSEGEYEEILQAKCRWFSPHPSICYFEVVDIMENETPSILRKQRLNLNSLQMAEKDIDLLGKLENIDTNSYEAQSDGYIKDLISGISLVNLEKDKDSRKAQISAQKNGFSHD